jgi:beta-glucosidase
MTWEEAYQKAEVTLSQMNETEKHALIRGLGWSNWNVEKYYYVGNTAPISRLGIPSLNMQDAAQGFRTYWSELVGTVTCWPSLLAAAATWDPDLVQQLAEAIGAEFAGKGANGILGPSVNVHRIARNGRNFEYISGEDPYLGSQLGAAYVRGIQSQGVITVLKHWVFNEQETNRNDYSVTVDEKTAWEVYYPPFQAAIEAGTPAVMCSYNKEDGVFSCSNEKHLKLLREKMGFQGFVQSDWWANHDVDTMSKGLDQEMPGDGGKWTEEALSSTKGTIQADISQAAKRVLAVMYRHGLQKSTRCSPPGCDNMMLAKVTSSAHRELARKSARESIVMLKNEGKVLPLSSKSAPTIAVIGAAAVAEAYNPNGDGQGSGTGDWSRGDYYSGGGSGHVVADPLVTPLEGIRKRAATAGVKVLASSSNDVTNATKAAKNADVAIVVVATTSGESTDRDNLKLDGDADELVAAVAKANPKTVVLVQSPGAWTMPWRHDVSSILALFLGGQETGSAWADALFGDVAPSGKLPIMLPETEEDAVPPSSAMVLTYSEGMKTSYRNKSFKAAYPFGHGLTYTTFDFGRLMASPCSDAVLCITVEVRNAGATAGRTVAQLYAEFPPAAGHPVALLKAFRKTQLLQPGGAEEVVFKLLERDLSYYDVDQADWQKAETVTMHVGESSKDIRATKTVTLTSPVVVAPNTDASSADSSTTSLPHSSGKASSSPGPGRHGSSGSWLSFSLLSAIAVVLCGLLAAGWLVQRMNDENSSFKSRLAPFIALRDFSRRHCHGELPMTAPSSPLPSTRELKTPRGGPSGPRMG